MPYNEALCKQIQLTISDKMGVHNTRLNDHSGRLDALEQEVSASKVQIDNLIKSIDSLVATMKWMIGLTLPVVLGFAGWMVKLHV
jgi:hypothetical protein